MYRGNDAQVKSIAGVIGEGAYPALAENHLVIALAHDVLGSHQQLLERRCHAALDSTGLRVRPARFSKEKFCILRAPI